MEAMVKIEIELQPVYRLCLRTDSGEIVLQKPIAPVLIESKGASMDDRVGQPRVASVLGVQHVGFRVTLPSMNCRTHVLAEDEGLTFNDFAYLPTVHSDSAVIGRGPKPISPTLACGIDECARVAQKGSTEREQRYRQDVGGGIGAAT